MPEIAESKVTPRTDNQMMIIACLFIDDANLRNMEAPTSTVEDHQGKCAHVVAMDCQRQVKSWYIADHSVANLRLSLG